MMSVASQKRSPFSDDFSRGNRKRSAGVRLGECGEYSSVVTLFFAKNSLTKTEVCWSIIVRKKPTVGFPFFGVFSSDRTPKAMKDMNVHFFIHSSISYKLCQRIPRTFWSCCYLHFNCCKLAFHFHLSSQPVSVTSTFIFSDIMSNNSPSPFLLFLATN